MSLFAIVQSKIIPDIFPTIAYGDVYQSMYDPIKIDLHSVEINGNDLNNKEIKIQSWVYQKYELTIYAKESNNIELFRFADDLQITMKDGTTIHQAKVLTLDEGERIEKTELRRFKLTYYDENSEAVNNYQTSDVLIPQFGSNQTLLLIYVAPKSGVYIDSYYTSVSSGGIYQFYSRIDPVVDISERFEENVELDTRLIKPSEITSAKMWKMRFYLSELEKNIFLQYAPMMDLVRATINSVTYDAIERVEPDIEEIGAKEVYEVTFNLKYSNTPYFPYST